MFKLITICLVLSVLIVEYSDAKSVYKPLNPDQAHFLDEASPDSIIARKQRLAQELAEAESPHNRDKRSWSFGDLFRRRHKNCSYQYGSSEELRACNNYWDYVDRNGSPPPYYVRPFYGMPHPQGGAAINQPHYPYGG